MPERWPTQEQQSAPRMCWKTLSADRDGSRIGSPSAEARHEVLCNRKAPPKAIVEPIAL
jgi:hypothetical protein